MERISGGGTEVSVMQEKIRCFWKGACAAVVKKEDRFQEKRTEEKRRKRNEE